MADLTPSSASGAWTWRRQYISQVELNEQLSFLPVLCQFTQICHLVVAPAVKCFTVKVSYYGILRNDSRRKRSLFFQLLLFHPCPGDSTCSCLLRNVTDTCLCCLMFLIKKEEDWSFLQRFFFIYFNLLYKGDPSSTSDSQTLIVIEHLKLQVLGTERNP